MTKTETRELTAYDLDKIIEQGTIADQHPIIQQLALSRLMKMAGISNAALFDPPETNNLHSNIRREPK